MSEAAKSAQGTPWRIVGGMAGLVAILSIMTFSQANFQDEDAEANQVLSGGAFGYADADGKRVVAPVESGLARNMKRFTKAVAAPGKVVDVTFVEARPGAEDGTGRLDPAGFDATPGAVFASGEPLPAGGDVLVATDRFLADRHVLTITPLDHPDCARAITAALSRHAGQPVAWCKDLARIGEHGRLSLARFETKNAKGRLTLTYIDPTSAVFRDLPEEPAGTDPDQRRDAAFAPGSVRPLFAFRSRTGLEVAVRRTDAAHEEMDLYRQDGETFTPFVAASWSRDDG